MSDKDVFERTEGGVGTGSSGGSEENMGALESMIREYEAKMATEKKKNEVKNSNNQNYNAGSLDAIRRELEKLGGNTDIENEDEYDDSDMKIARQRVNEFERDELPADEKNDETSERKQNIMSEISRHFQETEANAEESEELEESSDSDEEFTKSDIKTEQLPDSEKEEIEIGAEGDEAGEKDTHEHKGRGRISIDDSALKKAFSEDGYDIFGGTGRKRKNKNRDNPGGESSDSNEPDYKASRRQSRYDENGDRIAAESMFFTPKYEYKRDSDPAAVMADLRTKLLGSCFALIAVFAIMIACFYTEIAPSIGLPHFKVFEPGKTGIVYLLFDLQLLFAAVIIKLNSVCRGAVSLFSKTPTAESAAFASVLAAVIHTLSLAFAGNAAGQQFVPVCSVACLSVLLLSLSDFFRARTEYMSFRIVSSDNDKYAFKDLSASSEETPDEISKFVPEGSTVLDIRKIGFCEGFFAKSVKPAAADKNNSALIIAAFAVAAIASAVYCIINKEPAYKAFCSFSTIMLASVQSCMLISTSLPEFIFADRASRRKCALIGHAVCEEFDNVSVVSFKDTEVFSPKDIKVMNIRTYGDSRIDNVIVTMARVFGVIGGPLSSVFTNSISGISLENDDVKIIDVAPDGLWMKIDGENVYVGTASYMAENNFDTNGEAADESFRQTNGGILYLASSQSVLAKFYIKYTLNPAFESILRTLYTQGICARIKTLDPCINNDFIRACLRRPECLFSVVKENDVSEHDKAEDSLSGSLVSASGESSLIYSFLLVRKMKSVIHLNNCIKVFALIVSLALSTFALLGGSLVLPTAVILLIQIFWIIPVFIVAKLSSNR